MEGQPAAIGGVFGQPADRFISVDLLLRGQFNPKGAFVKTYQVTFISESGDTAHCLVEAYNRYRALLSAMIQTATPHFRNVTITPAVGR